MITSYRSNFSLVSSLVSRSLAVGLGVLGALSSVSAQVAPKGTKPTLAQASAFQESRVNRSLSFMENKGQWDKDALFLARPRGLNLWVTPMGLAFDFYERAAGKDDGVVAGHVVGLEFVGAKGAAEGKEKLRITTDFVKGGDSVKGAANFGEVRAKLYPGVQSRYYFDQGNARYDLIVAPGADTSRIKMKFNGADGLKVERNKLSIDTKVGERTQTGLVAYQTVAGKRVTVPVAFNKLDKDTVGFKLGKYDKSKPLVIDPIVYGSYYGSDNGWDRVQAVAADIDGGVYMTGRTWAPNFPRIYGPYSFSLSGNSDAFVSRLQGDAYNHDYAAYLGGASDDSGDFIQIDQFGDVWIAGLTRSADFAQVPRANVMKLVRGGKTREGDPVKDIPGFPPIIKQQPGENSTYRLVYPGLGPTAKISAAASAAEVEAAIEALLGFGTATVTGGPGEYTITLDSAFPGQLAVDNDTMRARYKWRVLAPFGQFPNAFTYGVAIRLEPDATTPTAGFFRLAHFYKVGTQTFKATSGAIPYNATAAQIDAALQTFTRDPNDTSSTPIGVSVQSIFAANDERTGQLPAEAMIVLFNGETPMLYIDQNTTNAFWQVIGEPVSFFEWNSEYARPNSGYFAFADEPFPTTLTQYSDGNPTDIPYNAGPAEFAQKLETLTGNNTVLIDSFGLNLPQGSYRVLGAGDALGLTISPRIVEQPDFTGSLLQGTLQLRKNVELLPQPEYTVYKEADIFTIRFKRSTLPPLDPLPTRMYIFGGATEEDLVAFRIIPDETPTAGDPVRMVFGIDNTPLISLITKNSPLGTTGSFIKLNFTEAGGFSVDTALSQYVGSASVPLTLRGLDVDAEGNVYIAGRAELPANVTIDTAVNPAVFLTSAVNSEGYLRDGRLLRGWDAYVRKYGPGGNLIYSVLVGGNGQDQGMGVAVDSQGNAYLTGLAPSTSFNFPRTRGVYGEDFSGGGLFVSKLNRNASDLLYSTHMRASGSVRPVGIGVDSRGIAYLTCLMGASETVNTPALQAPPTISQRLGIGSVQLTGDAIDSDFSLPPLPAIHTSEGVLLALNPSATALLYGTYIGSVLDDVVYQPYIDPFGDVWIPGYSESFRAYYIMARQYGTGLFTYRQLTRLPNAFTTSLAWRARPDLNDGQGGAGTMSTAYPYPNLNWIGHFPASFPYRSSMFQDQDGFLFRFRIALPTVVNVTFNPSTVAAGLGATSTGRVNIGAPAPAGGAIVSLRLSSTSAASFSPNEDQQTRTLIIPAGQTGANFTVYSKEVIDSTPVDVRATYEGNFKVGRLVVTPWLQSFVVTPNEIVGGNPVTGRVTLAQNAPAGGLTVELTADLKDVVPVTSVTVPAGQNATSFELETNGVDKLEKVALTASLAGVGRNASLTVSTAKPVSVTFNPTRVTAGTSTTGTVKLNGKPGPSGFTVNLSVDGNPPGYTITPAQVTFTGDQITRTFSLSTPFEPVNVARTVRASRPAQAPGYPNSLAVGTIYVDASTLTGFTITPTTIASGGTATGTVTISTPAQAGGAVVKITYTPASNAMTIPTEVIVPQGKTTATFDITAGALLNQTAFSITASRGGTPITRTLTVSPAVLSITVVPNVVVGGASAIGTAKLSTVAGAAGVKVTLTSSRTDALTVPSSVTIPAGSDTVNFAVATKPVTNDAVVSVTGKAGNLTRSTFVTVTLAKPVSLSFNPSVVRGIQTTRCTIRLTGPAPAGGMTFTLNPSNRMVVSVPTSVTVPQGQSSITFTVLTRRVSLRQTVIVTGKNANGTTVQGALTITP